MPLCPSRLVISTALAVQQSSLSGESRSKVAIQIASSGRLYSNFQEEMGLQGYVGSGEDVRRIRRQEQQLEEERKKRETEKQQRDANVSAAGFRQFGKGATEASQAGRPCSSLQSPDTTFFYLCLQTLEAAISQQTVGLVTRAEFAQKQKTLQEQIAAHQDKRKRDELEAANKV